jgi:MFS transporter, ACS family, hexuronate transporter
MAQTSSTASLLPDSSDSQRATRFRWVMCALLFYATTLNYVDRSVLNVLAPDLQKSIGWNDAQYGEIGAAFTAAYAIGYLCMGRLVDGIGTRIGYAIALGFWTLAGASTALARTTFQFGVCRAFLGLFEAGNFPAAIKTTAEWFPQKERATATGIFNAGSNVGAILAPLIVPFVVLRWNWQAAFLITPLMAVVWIILWLTLYRSPTVHPRVNQAERELILADSPATLSTSPVRWREILPYRQAWAIMVGKFLIDPIWWFYLFWSGKFLHDKFGADLKHLGPPLIVIYVLADFGSVLGGWFSSRLIRIGWTPNAARKTALFVCAAAVLPVAFAPVVQHMWTAVVLVGIAAAAHQGFSANLFTLSSDMFRKNVVGSITGLAGLCGAVGGMLMQYYSGRIKQATGSYLIMFIIAGSVYLLAAISVQLLAPNLERVEIGESRGFEVNP